MGKLRPARLKPKGGGSWKGATIVKLSWYGKKQKKVIKDAIHRAQIAEGVELVRKIRNRIKRPWPPASKPGSPPRRRTGNLYRNIQFWDNKSKFEIRVGPTEDALYGLFLDVGTVKIAARPFLAAPAKASRVSYPRRVRNEIKRSVK